jgi:hypothetical protein
MDTDLALNVAGPAIFFGFWILRYKVHKPNSKLPEVASVNDRICTMLNQSIQIIHGNRSDPDPFLWGMLQIAKMMIIIADPEHSFQGGGGGV